MEKNNQDQRSGNHSTNIQAGGNVTVVGISYEDAKQIALDVFKTNFLSLQGEAQKIALQRAEELIMAFLAKLQKEKISLDAAKDPDMQHVLFSAQRDYARSGKDNLQMLLVDILVERAKTDDELKKIVLNEAILVAPKLTVKQLNAISVRFLIAESRNHSINSIDTFNAYLKTNLLPFCSALALERSDYKHIEYAGCGTVNLIINNDIYAYFKGNYAGVLSLGFEDSSLAPLTLTSQQRSKLIIPCLRDPSKFQISVINDESIDTSAKAVGLDENKITQLKDLQNTHLLSKEALEQQLVSLNSKFSELLSTWSKSGLGGLELTTVGIALAHANIKKTIGIDLDLGIWIK